MAVTMADVTIVMIAFTICFMIAEAAKQYVRRHCQDNPEIIWIWLDDDEEPHGGCREKKNGTEKHTNNALRPVPCFNGI